MFNPHPIKKGGLQGIERFFQLPLQPQGLFDIQNGAHLVMVHPAHLHAEDRVPAWCVQLNPQPVDVTWHRLRL